MVPFHCGTETEDFRSPFFHCLNQQYVCMEDMFWQFLVVVTLTLKMPLMRPYCTYIEIFQCGGIPFVKEPKSFFHGCMIFQQGIIIYNMYLYIDFSLNRELFREAGGTPEWRRKNQNFTSLIKASTFIKK